MKAIQHYNLDTIVGTALHNGDLFPNKPIMKSRYDKQGRRTDRIHTYTCQEMSDITWDLGCALYAFGFRESDRLAVFAPNRPECMFAAGGALLLRGAMVPVYSTSKPDDVWWILHDSETRFCFCGDREQLERVLQVRNRLERLEKIIVMSPLDREYDEMVIYLGDFLKWGRENRYRRPEIEKIVAAAAEEDMVAVFYTSGTTGRPKGAILTNRNIISQREIIADMGFRREDTWMAHLPFCHVYGFSADLMGCGYVPGLLAIVDSLETDEIRWALSTYRPTVMNSVPRLWEKVYLEICSLLRERTAFVQKYFWWASRVGSEAYLLKSEKKRVPLSSRLKLLLCQPLFLVVKRMAGLNRLRFCTTGGAAISRELIVFFGGLGIDIYQGYGLTETSPIINVNTPRENRIGSVGKPLPGVEQKIAADGEILVRGAQVMKGYWKNPAANKEVFTADRFFRTGDVGFIDEEGYLTITDRKKELLKTSGGKYVAPQPIENAFNTDPYIEQVVVVGESRKYISTLVVPEFAALEKWAREQGIGYRNYTELVRDSRVKELVQQSIERINKTLAGYEQIKQYRIVDQPFSEETGELTPSLKVKRRVVDEKYKALIDEMYPAGDTFRAIL
ncbi:MAG: long-chain fatty acid--CoA ligase [Firmicutes bacterium]|nr:long-chain fatty acid--CoA ligase [Bacillota bacterium]